VPIEDYCEDILDRRYEILEENVILEKPALDLWQMELLASGAVSASIFSSFCPPL
jgi:hypothetical protein